MCTKFLDVLAHIFYPSTQNTEIYGSLWDQAQSGLYSELQNRQGYRERACLKKIYQVHEIDAASGKNNQW